MPPHNYNNITRTGLPPIIALILMLCLLSGCNREQTNPDHIDAGNTHGYYFDVYTTESKDRPRSSTMEMSAFDEELYFEIQNSAQERQFAVKVLVDYKQAQFIVDGIEHSIYLFDAEANAAKICAFRLVEPLDTDYNHTLTVILIAGSDMLTNKTDFEMSANFSLSYNYLLQLDDDKPVVQPDQLPAETELVTEYQSTGLLFNADTVNRSRVIPDREMFASPGETIELQYQVGGYEGVDDVAIVAMLGLEQVALNGKPYLTCFTENGALVSGTASIIAPMEVGEYEFMAWVVPNPFAPEENEFIMLDSAFRFTLVVS